VTDGAPFKDWLLPASLERVRRKLKGSDDGDRQMVKVLSAVLSDGLTAVEADVIAFHDLEATVEVCTQLPTKPIRSDIRRPLSRNRA
jgi:hypothetical protein